MYSTFGLLGILQVDMSRESMIWSPHSSLFSFLNSFLMVIFFCPHYYSIIDADLGSFDLSLLNREHVEIVEADSFWCVSALLDTIQDNYTFAQPGIQRKVNDLRELISRVERECLIEILQMFNTISFEKWPHTYNLTCVFSSPAFRLL